MCGWAPTMRNVVMTEIASERHGDSSPVRRTHARSTAHYPLRRGRATCCRICQWMTCSGSRTRSSTRCPCGRSMTARTTAAATSSDCGRNCPTSSGLGVDCIWLLPFYPVPAERRRLRHRRFLRGTSGLRHAGGFQGVPRPRARTGPARDRRPCPQPHLGSAPVVPGGAQIPRLAVPPLLRLERRSDPLQGRADHLHGYRNLQLDLRSGGGSVLLAPLLQQPTGPQLRESRQSSRRCSR